ncbi:hypothetical protein BMS3Abin11_02583 [bacterium BMS3Abin11]|nr:hypothetical protein BMS3Abin11_02583 [bacterium BMS3Abin11]
MTFTNSLIFAVLPTSNKLFNFPDTFTEEKEVGFRNASSCPDNPSASVDSGTPNFSA